METRQRNPFRKYLIQSQQNADKRAQEAVIRRQQQAEEYEDYWNRINKEREERLLKIANEREDATELNTVASLPVSNSNSESEDKEKSGDFAEKLKLYDLFNTREQFLPAELLHQEDIMVPFMPGAQNIKKSNITSYSAEDLRDFFTNNILEQANEIYDGKIEELQNKINEEVEAGRLQAIADSKNYASKEDMQFSLFVNNRKTADNVSVLQHELDKLKQEKNTYILTALSMSDPYKLFSGQLNSIATNSDDFLKLRTAEEILRTNASNIKKEKSFDKNEQYKKALSEYFSAKIQSDDLARKYTELIDYLNVLGRLPKTLDEFPSQYRDAAKSMFTKNGQLLLTNQEFRDEFNTRNIVEKDQLENITALAKNIVSNASGLNSDYIKQKKEEIGLLRDYTAINADREFAYGGPLGATNIDGKSKQKLANLNSAERILEKAEKHQRLNEEVLKNKESFDLGIKNFLTAGREFFTNWNTYTFNTLDAADNVNTYLASKKLKAGKELSPSENALLLANLIENAFKQQYGDYQYVNSYKWSNIAMESLQFMAEFIATSPWGVALERGATKGVLKYGGQKLSQKALKAAKMLLGTASGELNPSVLSQYALNTVAKYGNVAAYKIYQAAGRLGADATYAALLANTLGLPKTVSDAAKSAAGVVDGGFDINGNPYVNDIKGEESLAKSILRSETRNFIENFSEMMGEWGIGSALRKGSKLVGLGNFMNKIEMAYKRDMVKEITQLSENYLKHGTSEINAVLRKAGLGKFIPRMDLVFNQRVLKAGRFNGFAGEVSEEYYGLILQHLLGVQDDPNKNLWDDVKGQTADIFGGIAVSTALLGAIGMASSVRSEMKYDNAVHNLQNLFGKETAYEIQKALTFAHPGDFYNTLDRLMDAYGEGKERGTLQKIKDTFSKNSSLDKKTALAEYAMALYGLRGAVYGEEAASKMMDKNARKIVRDARKNGYRIANYRNLNTMNNVVNILESDADSSVAEEGGAKGVLDKYDNNISKTIDAIKAGEVKLAEGETQESAIEKFMAYVNAINFREGIDLGLHDMASERAAKRASLALKFVNKNYGSIRVLYRPELKENGTETGKMERLYWIDGKLKTQSGEDTIDSAKNLYAADDNGKILVSDRTGLYRYIDRSDLNGWHISSEPINAQDAYNQLYLDEVENLWSAREQYLKELGDSPQMGDTIYVGNKILTILDANPRYGITYSLSDDEDGKNSRIYHAENVQSIQQFIDQSNKDQFKDITEYFKSFAKDEASRDEEPDRVVQLARQAVLTRNRLLKLREDEEKRKKQRAIDADQRRYDLEYDRGDVSDEMSDEEIAHNKQIAADELRFLKELERENVSDEVDVKPTEVPVQKVEEKDPLLEYEEQQRELSTTEQQNLEQSLIDYAKAGQTISAEDEAEELERLRKIKEEVEKANAEAEKRRKLIEQEEARRAAELGAPNDEVKKLVKEIGVSNDNKIATTGYHYIINVGRRHQLVKRVHSIIGDRRDNIESSKMRMRMTAEYIARLSNAEDLFAETEKILNEIYEKESKEYGEHVFINNELVSLAALYKMDREASLNIDAYKKYLKKHEDEKGEVIEGIANILSRTPSLTVIPGNVYDTIARYYLDFETKELQYEDPRLTTRVYGVTTHISTPLKYKKENGEITEMPLVTKEAFDAICKELQKIKDYFKAIGWTPVCKNGYTLVAKVLVDGKEQWVGGETDCIAIDDHGRRQLIDFKTYNINTKVFFDRVVGDSVEGSEFFNKSTKSENKYHDLDDKTLMLYSNAVQYARQLAAYKILAASNGFYFMGSYAMLFGIDYGFRAKAYISIDESTEEGRAQNVSNSSIVIEDINGGEVPNLVNLDNKEDQNEDVKTWVKDLEKRVQVIESDDVKRLKQQLEFAKIEINPEERLAISESTLEQVDNYNKEIEDLKSRLLNDEKSITNAMIQSRLIMKQTIEELITDDIEKYHREQDEKERIINAMNAINLSYESVELGLYNQFLTVVGQIIGISDGNTQHIDKDDIEDEDLKQLSQDIVFLGIWIKLTAIVSPQSEILSNAIKHYNWVLRELFTDEERENILKAVRDNDFSGNKDGIDEALKRKEWYEITQLISSADSYSGKNMDSSIGDKGTKLVDVTNNRNFINDATFYIQRTPEHANDEHPLFEITIVYAGEKFSPVVLNFAHTGKDYSQSKELYNTLCNLTENDKTAKVKLNNSAFHRTFGEIKSTPELRMLNLDFFQKFIGSKITSWADIMYAKDGVDFGLTKKQIINGIPYVVVAVPGYASGTKQQAYVYTGKHKETTPPVGGVVFLYRPNYAELGTENRESFTQDCVPINLISPNFDKDSAQLILDILSGNHANVKDGEQILDFIGKEFIQNKGTKNERRLPLTNILVLNLFISFGKQDGGSRKLPISLNIEDDGKITIAGLFNFNDPEISNDGSPLIYSKSFDLSSDEDKKDFLAFLQEHVRMQINESVLSDTFNNMSHTLPVNKIKKFFNESGLEELRVGDVVLFSKDDVEDGKEITGLGWYIKHGRLLSDFDGMENPLISIDEETAIDTTPEQLDNPIVKEGSKTEDKPEQMTADNIDDFTSFAFGEEEHVSEKERESKYAPVEEMKTGSLKSTTDSEMQLADWSINEDEARQRIKEIVGDVYVPEFSDEVLGSIGNAQIVGACYTYMILLSKKARRGTEYHEAFHMVLELLISDKQRERAYKAYRKKFGKNLSDTEVAEKAADDFWWYKENKPNRFKFEFSIKGMLDQFKRWYRFYTKIGSYTLWQLYRSAANGVYKNCKPTAEAIARWDRLTSGKGYLTSIYEADGMKFDHIMNSEEYKAVCETIKMIVLDRDTYANEETGCPFDIAGKDLSSMKISTALIRKSPRLREIMTNPDINKEAKLKLYELLGYGRINGKPAIINNNLEVVLGSIIKDLKQYLMSASVPKISPESKKSSGKSRIEKINSSDDLDEMQNTLNREMREYQTISANFDPITGATPRVKYFFSILDDTERVPIIGKDEDGKDIIVGYKYLQRLNKAGLPQYLDPKTAWDFVLNRIYDCRSQLDLYERLRQLKDLDQRFVPLYNKYTQLLKLAYETDKNGSVFNNDGSLRQVKDVDKEGLVIEITSTINHAKNIPGTMQYMKSTDDDDKYGSTRQINASMQYLSRDFRLNWSDMIASGENRYIEKDKDGMFRLREGASELIRALAEWFKLFTNLFNTNERFRKEDLLKIIQILVGDSVYAGSNIDLNNKLFIDELKKQFVYKLNSLNIDVSVYDIDYILESLYGDTGKGGMTAFLNEYAEHINGGFVTTIKGLLNLKSGSRLDDFKKWNRILPLIWTNTGHNGVTWNKFLDTLSLAKYNRISDEKLVRYLTVGGNSQYAMSELNFITDSVFYLTQQDSQIREQLISDPYYESSRFLLFCQDHKQNPKDLLFLFIPVPGLKTDAVGSEGVEYLQLSEQEDIICKYGLLATNLIILPTMSDKTTYGGVQGTSAFSAFGIDYTKLADEKYIGNLRTFLGKTNYVSKSSTNISLRFNDDVLDLFIAYAKSEYDSAKRESARIKYEESQKGTEFSSVQNLDNGKPVEITRVVGGKEIKETHIIHQGARLATFTGIIDEDGKFISFNKLYNEDGSYCSEEQNLENARNLFFGLRPEDLREIMARILSRQVLKELEYLQSKGMIILDDNGYWKNVDLDRVKMKRIQWAMANISEKPAYVAEGLLHSDALIAYVADIVCKQQMSMQESFRIFSVDPRAFNWEYNNNGFLIDSTKDLFKRLGGLVSTGSHNVEDVNGIDKEVVCAEMHDTKYTSELFGEFKEQALKQELIKQIRGILFSMNVGTAESGKIALRDPITIDNEVLYKQKVDQISSELNEMSIDQLKKKLESTLILLRSLELDKDGITVSNEIGETIRAEAKEMVALLEFTINRLNDAFNKLNTTDGATFITDEFCEDLLHVIGKWDKDIAKAFKILREADSNKKSYTNEQIRSLAEAYNMIYTTVIGTLKYTGYGYRTQKAKYKDESGQICEYDRLITFYDKTAYFPIFNCMASGHMKAILKKMKDEGVQVLKTTSAIKVGGADAVDCNDSTFESWSDDAESYKNFKFNTYTQSLLSIRKQFNTDPKGKELMPLGTQFVKVLLSLIEAGLSYDINGELLSAYDVREQIMTAINKIALAGHKEHMARFYTDGRLDLEKFLGILRRQLEDKDANDPLLKSLKIEKYRIQREVTDPNTKETTVVTETRKRFHLPIAAMSSTQWIESIVTSVVNKEILDINTPGLAFYQRPVWGMEGKIKMNYINEDDWEYTINHGEKLKVINDDKSMDCVLSIDFFDYLFDQHPGLKNQSFLAKKDWLIRHGIISGFIKDVDKSRFDENELELIDGKWWHNAKANIVGYRIPTQAVSSIHAMRCVDVICATRDTIILPREITAITGSDFDIDKFFLSTLYYKYLYKKDSDERRREIFEEVSRIANTVYERGITTEDELDEAIKIAKKQGDEEVLKQLNPFKEELHTLWKQGYLDSEYNDDVDSYEHNANKLIKTQIALLRTTENNISQLHGSIDVDAEPLKAIAKKIDAKNPHGPLDPFDMTSMRSNVTAKMSFAIGKEGIGPYALNNNNHVFTMLYGVKFVHQKDGILDILDLEDLGKRFDRNGHSILSWLSGLINAHVDVAKDPYVRSLGVNKYTYNLVSLLIRTGYGAETFWFTTQPIMSKFYDAYDRASGIYGLDENRSVYTRTNEEIDKVFIDYINDKFGEKLTEDGSTIKLNSRDTAADKFVKYLRKTRNIDINTAIKRVMKYKAGVKVLEEISCSKESDLRDDKIYDLGDGIKLSYPEIQAVVAIAQFALLEKASQLSKLVQYTKIDTKKQGITISEQEAYLNNFEQLLNEKTSPFEYQSIKKMIGDENIVSSSFINLKTRLAIDTTRELMSSQLILATVGYSELERKMRGLLNIDRIDEKTNTSIMKMIVGKIKADYFFKGPNSYCIKRAIVPESLMAGSTSIYRQLMAIKAGISNPNDHRFDSVRDKTTGLCNNYLINSLISHRVANKESMVEEDQINVSALPFFDDWLDSQFVRLQSFTEDAIKSTSITDAWDDLLNDSSSPILRNFAERLVVYAYMTSAAVGSKYDLSKFVPVSWATGECLLLRNVTDYQEDSFASYISQILEKLNSTDSSERDLGWTNDEISELILNFSWDNNIVPILKSSRLDNVEGFYRTDSLGIQTGNPLMFGAINISLSGARTTYEQGKHPTFIKVRSDSDTLSGLGKYDIYECVANAQYKVGEGEDARTYTYPIYAMVAPSGGTYAGGQRIFAIDVQGTTVNRTIDTETTTKKQSGFRKYWTSSIKWLLDNVESSDQIDSPKGLMILLLYMMTHDEFTEKNARIKQLLNNDPFGYKSALLELINGAKLYGESTDNAVFDSYQDYLLNNTLSTDKSRKQINYYEESTFLNLLDRPKEEDEDLVKYYSKMSEEEGLAIFGKEKVEAVRRKKLHVEFYKLHHNIKDGKDFYNPVMTISLIGQKSKGFFQLNADVDLETHKLNGEYSVHFKTYVSKMREDTKFASVLMSDSNKTLLMQMIISVIPDGGKLSTWGSISDGAIKALNDLYKYVNETTGYIAKVGVRKLTHKKTKEAVDVPVWEKNDKYAGLYKGKDGYDPNADIEDAKFPDETKPEGASGKPYSEYVEYVGKLLLNHFNEFRKKNPASNMPFDLIYKEKLLELTRQNADLRNSIISIPSGEAINYPFGLVIKEVQTTLLMEDAKESSEPCLPY